MNSDRAGSYGIDAPYVPLLTGIGGLLFWALYLVGSLPLDLIWLVSAIVMTYQLWQYLYATRVGKFKVWDELLDDLDLTGAERILDIGCGRGAVLLAAAARVPRGKAVGVDLWRSVDQSGNSQDVTFDNARAEGVLDRIELATADMTKLPFGDESFDVVLASIAMHNVPSRRARAAALAEAFRVMKPGGKLVIADIKYTGSYADDLRALGAGKVVRRNLGWRFWFGGPWMATRVVTADK